MYHYLICCKLKFDPHKNNKLYYVLNIHIITNLYFRITLFYFKLKITIYMHKKVLSFIQIKFTCNLMLS